MTFTEGFSKTASLSAEAGKTVADRLKNVDTKAVDHFVGKLKSHLGDFKYKNLQQQAAAAGSQAKAGIKSALSKAE